jgi:hypothetical protein
MHQVPWEGGTLSFWIVPGLNESTNLENHNASDSEEPMLVVDPIVEKMDDDECMYLLLMWFVPNF